MRGFKGTKSLAAGTPKGGDYTPSSQANCLDFKHLRIDVNRAQGSSVISPGLRQKPVFIQTTREEKPMKQLFAALVAAAFAAASFAALAQDKKMDKMDKMDKKAEAKKTEAKKGDTKKKSEGKKSADKKKSDKMDKMDKKS